MSRLRMLVVDGAVPAGEPVAVDRVADLLCVEVDLAWTVLMELGRDGFLERVSDQSVRVRGYGENPEDEVIGLRRLLEPIGVRAAAAQVRPVDGCWWMSTTRSSRSTGTPGRALGSGTPGCVV